MTSPTANNISAVNALLPSKKLRTPGMRKNMENTVFRRYFFGTGGAVYDPIAVCPKTVLFVSAPPKAPRPPKKPSPPLRDVE
jgi:hypothetical protein